MNPNKGYEFKSSRNGRLKRVRGALFAGILLTGSACSGSDGESFTGGCDVFRVYAQNRYAPLGAAVRAEPDVLSEKLEPSFAGNEVIAVDGWVETGEPAYPTNPAPWNSDVWFHLANRRGWVNFAAVRAEPTTPDPTGLARDGGAPASTAPDCRGEYHPQ